MSYLKIFISVDLEGVGGIVSPEHTRIEGKEHERARHLMTGEVNAAINGILEACKPKNIVVNDSHATMCNIIPEELHETAELIMGSPKPLAMMEGIDESFDAAFFIGYHAMNLGLVSLPRVLLFLFSTAGSLIEESRRKGSRVSRN